MERARFAAAGPADHGDELAGVNAEAQIADRFERIATGVKNFAEIAALDLGHESARRRPPLEQALLGFRNKSLQDQSQEDQDQRPGKNPAHVEQRLLLHHPITDAGGGAHQLRDNHDTHGKADGNFPGSENTRDNRWQNQQPKHLGTRRSERQRHFEQFPGNTLDRVENAVRENRE